jgi:hypothetical protein
MDDRDYQEKDEIDLEDPLKIAREPVPHDPAIHAGDDEAEVRRRRKRAGLGADKEPHSTGLESLDQDPFGATGIDMGAGKGTDVKP